jgi:hypothetical protein
MVFLPQKSFAICLFFKPETVSINKKAKKFKEPISGAFYALKYIRTTIKKNRFTKNSMKNFFLMIFNKLFRLHGKIYVPNFYLIE